MAIDQTQTAQDVIAEMVRWIVEGFDPHKIVLFGSYARGLAGPDSDVDLLDVIVVTPEEVERYGNLVGTVIRPALHEGKVLYERPG